MGGVMSDIGDGLKYDFGVVGNFIKHDAESMLHFQQGVAGAIGGVFGGITTGKWDFTSARNAFEDYAYDVKDAFTNTNNYMDHSTAPNYAQQVAKTYEMLSNPANSGYNMTDAVGHSNPKSNNVVGFGRAVGNDNTRPSDLMKIRDPTVKMAVAGSRGGSRQQLNLVGKAFDVSNINNLTGQPTGGASNTINAAGGTGAQVSDDLAGNQHTGP